MALITRSNFKPSFKGWAYQLGSSNESWKEVAFCRGYRTALTQPKEKATLLQWLWRQFTVAVKGVEVASLTQAVGFLSMAKEYLPSKIAFCLSNRILPFLRSQITVKEIRLAQFGKNWTFIYILMTDNHMGFFALFKIKESSIQTDVTEALISGLSEVQLLYLSRAIISSVDSSF